MEQRPICFRKEVHQLVNAEKLMELAGSIAIGDISERLPGSLSKKTGGVGHHRATLGEFDGTEFGMKNNRRNRSWQSETVRAPKSWVIPPLSCRPRHDEPGTLHQQINALDLYHVDPTRHYDAHGAWDMARRLSIPHARRRP